MVNFQHRFVCAAVTVLVGLAAHVSRAGVLDNGFVTLDTETGLEWLDMSYTNGGYPAQWLYPGSHGLLPFQIKGGVPAGFRVATQSEALSLFNAIGVAPNLDLSLAAYTAIDTLLTFMTPLGVVDNRFYTNGRYYGNRYAWFYGATATLTPQTNDSQYKLVGYWLRVDENYNSYEFTGTLRTMDGSNGFYPALDAYAASTGYGTFLVRNRANGTPASAAAPTSNTGGTQVFAGVDGNGIWFDVDRLGEPALKFTATAPSLFTAVGLPASFSDADNLASVIDPTLGEILLGPGDIHVFSTPVSMFELGGLIDAPFGVLAAASSSSLPVLLQFDQATADFSVAAVPEPATVALLGVGLLLPVRRGVAGARQCA